MNHHEFEVRTYTSVQLTNAQARKVRKTVTGVLVEIGLRGVRVVVHPKVDTRNRIVVEQTRRVTGEWCIACGDNTADNEAALKDAIKSALPAHRIFSDVSVVFDRGSGARVRTTGCRRRSRGRGRRPAVRN